MQSFTQLMISPELVEKKTFKYMPTIPLGEEDRDEKGFLEQPFASNEER